MSTPATSQLLPKATLENAPNTALDLAVLVAKTRSNDPRRQIERLRDAFNSCRADPSCHETLDFIPWLANELGMTCVDMRQLVGWQPDFDAMPFSDCAANGCAVVHASEGAVCLIFTDPFDTDRLAWGTTMLGGHHLVLVSSETFEAWLTHCESGISALGNLGASTAGDATAEAATHAEVLNLRDIGAHESPAVRFVNSTLYDALKTGASDIHLESDPAGLAVKFRIDGVLNAMRRLDSVELATQAISRIKVMAQLDISERRVPQDGRLQISYEGRTIDVRVSVMPSIHGEDAVLRVLDRQHLAQSMEGLTLAKLGFDAVIIEALHRLCRKPHGMMLVTGPTGSGKTTTLYAAIAETHQSRDKIITIEDPVEYQLPGVLQIPVNERKGLTFARGLRSILRHDPDKILVGEIRDAETAQIAVQSALTGHLVFTTVHANNAIDVVGRFNQFGIDAYTFASAINAILAQRLLRRVCEHCARPRHDFGDAELSEPLPRLAGPPRWLAAVGCERCRGTGYNGRFALGELLEMTPAMKSLIAARASFEDIQRQAEQQGWRSLRDLAFQAAAEGHTTLEEVDRVAA